MKCSRCNEEVNTRLILGVCSKCYQRDKNTKSKVVHELPPVGEIRYDSEGNLICHICGRSYKRLLTHVRQIHGMTGLEYKTEFGLNRIKGLLSDDTRQKSREAVFNNYDKCVKNNLIAKGEETRFIVGSKGRTRDKLSVQEYNRLVEYAKTIGVNNLKRHNKKED